MSAARDISIVADSATKDGTGECSGDGAALVTGVSTADGSGTATTLMIGISALAVLSGFGFPLPSHCAARIATPKLFAGGPTFSAYSFASIPFGNKIRYAS